MPEAFQLLFDNLMPMETLVLSPRNTLRLL